MQGRKFASLIRFSCVLSLSMFVVMLGGLQKPEAAVQTASFGAKTDFETDPGPRSVAVGDFNGDGKLDLATANNSFNTVSILLGTGTGSFGAKTDFDTGAGPRSVAVGDFNGDGKLDLAVANRNNNKVAILLGTGTGSFGFKTDFGTGAFPVSVAVGDFNGDGKLDLAVTNDGSATVSILLGTGTGSFGAKTDFDTGSAPQSVAVGDFNGDGKLDLAVANFDSDKVSILLGTGTGSFGAKTDFDTGSDPRSVAVGDFNGDGKLDLAVANANSASVSILLGTGTGSFGATTDFGTGTTPFSVAVGDFNGDGKLDLAVANANSASVSILLGTGTGSFGAKTDFGTGSAASVAVGDFNGDGKFDLAVANFGNTVSILLNTTPIVPSGVFCAKSDFGTGVGPRWVVPGDFNGDGQLDLAVANENSDRVSILLGTGTGSFGAKTDFGTGSAPISVAVGDFNGDGKLDLAVANRSSNNVSILLGTGTGSFGLKTDFDTGSSPASVAVGDFNGDGKLDLAVANQNSVNVSILLGTGTGSFGLKTDFGTGTTPASVAVGDFNGDGKLDLAVANFNSNNVSILLGTGTGSFGLKTNFDTGAFPASVAVGDFNGDGKLDLAVANDGSATVSILLGTGTGSFGAKTDFGTGSDPFSVAVGDFNGDGKLDLAVANFSSNNVSILLGTGTGSFGAKTDFGTGSAPVSVALGDFNGDGKLDLAVANQNSVNVSILLNNTPPSITADPVTRTAGSPSANSQIATVDDAQDALDTLSVTVNGSPSATVNGVTVTLNPTAPNSQGQVFADVVASCAATTANFTLRVTDCGLFNETMLTVTVTANTHPVLTYSSPQSVTLNGSLMVGPATGPTDNNSVSTIAVQSVGTYSGGISVNNSTGIVAISNAAPVGTHTITIRATDNCGVVTDASFTLTVNKANQTITFGSLANKTFGDADFTVNPTASSGLAVSLSPSGNCTVSSPSPGTVHITGAGSCNITASQLGDATYNQATNVSQSFTINQANQTITFAAIANKTFGDPDFSVSPTASSGLAVSLLASGNCTVTSTSPGTVHLTGAGSCTITASRAGDSNYNKAADVPQSFAINCGSTVVANTNDSGSGSLRDVILHACPGATITFDPTLNGQTITLTSGELLINKDLTIQGPGANLLTISGNNSSRVFNVGAFTVTLSGLTMTNGNGADTGGAILNTGTLTVAKSTISSSTVTGSVVSLGGAIYSNGNLTLTDSTISGNSAAGSGTKEAGGVFIFGNHVAAFINSTLSGNSSGLGGAISCDPAATTTITNSTISGNAASILAGGVHASGTVNVRNTIIAGNTGGANPDVRNPFTSQGNNLIGAGDGSTGFTNGVNNDKVGTVASPINALLAPLGNYGGPTQTFALLPGSPAINAGNNAAINNPPFAGPPFTDQRGAGFNRIVGSNVDIGAFESRGFGITATSGTPQSAVFNTAFGAPLVATVSSAFGEPVSGGQVTFTAPGSGASATFTGGVTTINATIDGGGLASASATANAIVGVPYNATANGSGITGAANFSLTNLKANQTITFAGIGNKTFGDPDFTVSPSASSGLQPVSLGPSGNCTVTNSSPGMVHITGAGSCTITASQIGDASFNTAPNVPRSFNISKAFANPSVTSSVNPADLNQSVTFTATLTGPSGTRTPTGTVQFKDGGTNLGTPVTLNASGAAQLTTSALTTGNHNITADYSGDTNFLTVTGTLAGGQVVKAQPTLSINDVSIAEGHSGASILNFTVTLSAASSLTVTANYTTANGTATAPSDYTAIASTLLTFNPGDTSKTVAVTINGDISFEPDETFTVNLTNPTNTTITKAAGNGTIQNDDAQGGFFSFSPATYNMSEATGLVTVTVIRTNDVTQAANVDYATDDTGASTNCATLNTGLAAQRCDYTSVFGTLKFAANETQKTIDIPINLDAYTEGPENFTVKLSNPTGGAALIAPSSALVTINDSASPTPNAIDDTADFVRQQYHDFLNRDADPSGLAFWKNNIDKCNDPAQRPPGQTVAQCIEVQRILTSAAFFLSIEFRQTGGLVRDFYVASLFRPLTNNMPDYVEFMRDTQAIQRGVVVNQGNWQQTLDTNRQAFMNEFVTRAEFVALYPTTDTPTQYVDRLYQHANVTGTQQERLDAIAYFGGAVTAADTGARARALLRVTQSGDFQAREANRTFVQIEYFGYLRRNPNDAPDNNFDGYNFWVKKLIQVNGDFLQAEMVKAFLRSSEYRARFGP